MIVGRCFKMLRSQYLSGCKEEFLSSYPTVPSVLIADQSDATIDGTIADVFATYPELERVLFNEVKTCPNCSKPCASSLVECNGCGANLLDVLVTKVENVFVAFLLGVSKAQRGFPYKISKRLETSDVLVFDDLLQISPCHLNAIPKKYWIPNWRYLLTAPSQSLELVDAMLAELRNATKQFLQDPQFRALWPEGVTDDEICDSTICSFNDPPSQFQLHIQWVVPPAIPFHHHHAEAKQHFHRNRAIPMTYARKILLLNETYNVTSQTSLEEIFEHFRDRVNYEEEWTKFYEAALENSTRFSPWNPSNFKYVVQEDGKAYDFTVVDTEVRIGSPVEVDVNKLRMDDSKALQNYGRPYVDGKPSGTYISSPVKPRLGGDGFGLWPGLW